MSDQAEKTYKDFKLPPNIVSKVDVAHLANELERVDNEMTAGSVREKIGQDNEVSVTYSDQLKDFLNWNEMNLDDSHGRSELITQLRQLKDHVKEIHMTFAVTTDPESMQEITKWVRESVDPQAVISVGLQPALVAGVYVRTPNKVHDLSLRAMVEGSRSKLIEELGALRGNS
jgi:hypothetical protein